MLGLHALQEKEQLFGLVGWQAQMHLFAAACSLDSRRPKGQMT
jgi:hypothetical protein